HSAIFQVVREANRHLAEDRQLLFQPCFATRLGGVSGGKETQGWRDSSHCPCLRSSVSLWHIKWSALRWRSSSARAASPTRRDRVSALDIACDQRQGIQRVAM